MAELSLSYKEFSQRVTTDPRFRDKIGGFTSVSLSHLTKGASAGEVSLQPYQREQDTPHINCLLTPTMYKKVFDEESGITFTEARRTSEEYGTMWGLKELLAEKGYGSVTKESAQFDYIYYDLLNPDPSLADTEEDNPWETRDAEKIKELFGSQTNLDEILERSYYRGGVQVIYEKEHFGNFLEQQKLPLRSDDRHVDDGAIELFEPIPQESILAIIPLGEYEEELANTVLFEKDVDHS